MAMMAAKKNDGPSPDDPKDDSKPADESISPARRRLLQQAYEHAVKKSEEGTTRGIKSNFDYAHSQFTVCVLGDKGNRVYAQGMLDNLYKKYNNDKKGGKLAKLKTSGDRGKIKKAKAKKKWEDIFKPAIAVLKINPWDAVALLALAEAAENLGHHEPQLAYLKGAWIGNRNDAGVNRLCAQALARRGRFDEAIECWRRVKLINPKDDDADHEMGRLAVEKTIKKGGYDEAESTTDAMADKQEQAERRGEVERVTPEMKFRELIAAKPEDLSNYLELADLLSQEDRHGEAEEILTQALDASGGDIKVREHLEDAQMRRAQSEIRVAERRAAEDNTDESRALVKQMRSDLNRMELEVYRGRCERYPTNKRVRYELGLRLKRAGSFNEAIKQLQQVSNDANRKGLVYLELGECFASPKVKQYKLALTAFETAIDSLSAREQKERKRALYFAGKVALYLKDPQKADKHLNELAGLDFNYRDVESLLDKLAQMRQDE